MLKGFDMMSMLQASDAPKSANASRISGLLASSWLVAFGVALVLIALSLSSKEIDSVSALVRHEPISDKEYAQMRIESMVQYKCLSTLYGKESAWKSNASNGSHHGIPQGRSKWLATATPLQQIDWGLAYIAHRYGKVDGQPDTCAALDHWKKYNWH